MKDMRKGECAVCGHQEIWRTPASYADRSTTSRSVEPLKSIKAKYGALTVYVCPQCGFVQWFVEDYKQWRADAAPYVHRVRKPSETVPADDSAQTEFDLFLDDTNDCEMRIATAIDNAGLDDLVDNGLSLVTKVTPVKVASAITFDQAERLKLAINLAGGSARVEEAVVPPPPPPELPEADVYCSRCKQVVHRSQTYYTADGEVCPSCYKGFYS